MHNVVGLAKKMAKPVTKIVIRTVAVPKTKIIQQPTQQNNQTTEINGKNKSKSSWFAVFWMYG